MCLSLQVCPLKENISHCRGARLFILRKTKCFSLKFQRLDLNIILHLKGSFSDTFYSSFSNESSAVPSSKASFLYSLGDKLYLFLKALLKYRESEKPQLCAISHMLCLVETNISRATLRRNSF